MEKRESFFVVFVVITLIFVIPQAVLASAMSERKELLKGLVGTEISESVRFHSFNSVPSKVNWEVRATRKGLPVERFFGNIKLLNSRSIIFQISNKNGDKRFRLEVKEGQKVIKIIFGEVTAGKVTISPAFSITEEDEKLPIFSVVSRVLKDIGTNKLEEVILKAVGALSSSDLEKLIQHSKKKKRRRPNFDRGRT